MKASRALIAGLGLLLLAGVDGWAQQPGQQAAPQTTKPNAEPNAPPPNAPPTERPVEPGTHATQLTPASKAPKPVQQPDVRLDSKPHTDLDFSLDSSLTPPDLGLGASPEIDLGPDILPTTPPGMISRSVEDNPRLVYFALPHHSGEGIGQADGSLIASRQNDLVRAAAFHGFDLQQSGWQYQQGICPAMQPDAEQVVGVPAGGGGEGFIVLHFVRSKGNGRSSAFTAVIPREGTLPVRVISVVHGGVEEGHVLLGAKTSGTVVNEALPPATLYKNLEPVQGWIPASACIAELAGAYPHVPNEPYLSEDILTAPPPLLRLLRNGERKMVFTDRVDDGHYVVWDEHVSNHGRMLGAEHEVVRVMPRPVTNPPIPRTRFLVDLPEPKTRITPAPPSPLSGEKQ